MNSRLFIASFASSVVFSLGGICLMLVTAQIEQRHPSLSIFLNAAFRAFIIAMFLQLAYGALLLRLLNSRGLFRLPIVVLCYVVPVLLFALMAVESTGDLLSLAVWIIFALIVSATFWFFARVMPGEV